MRPYKRALWLGKRVGPTPTPSPGYDTDAQALFNAIATAGGSAPSTTDKDRAQAVITGLKGITMSAGGSAWSHAKRLGRFDFNDRISSRIDWKDPTKGVTENGSLSWNVTTGFNLTTSSNANYLDMGQAPSAWWSAASLGAIQVDIHTLVFKAFGGLIQDGLAARCQLGQDGGSGVFSYGINDGGSIGVDQAPTDTTASNWYKRLTLVRTDGSNKALFRGDGSTAYATKVKASSSVGAQNVKLLYGDNSNYYGPPDVGTKMRGVLVLDYTPTGADIAAINAVLAAFAP